MKKIYYVIACFFIIATSLTAQEKKTYKDYFTQGNFLILEENYGLALNSFMEAYKIDPSSANINYLVGYCYLKSETDKGKAIPFLEKAITNATKNYADLDPNEKHAPMLSFFYYGEALRYSYRFDEAVASYDKFKSSVKTTNSDMLVEVNKEMETAKFAKQMVAAPNDVEILNLGDSINSAYPEYSPVLSADESTIIFTSRRPGGTTDELTDDGKYYEDIYISYKKPDGTWKKPVGISSNINTPEHEAAVSLIADGQTLIYYKSVNGGDLFFSNLEENGWSFPLPMGSDINTEFWETSACLAPDGNTLYFVSNRPGGLGGRDIYKCNKLPNGLWAKALNLGSPINTPYDEESPYIDPNGNLLFFASKGHTNMGGFDIFYSYKNDSSGLWEEPTNLLYPINTPDDDVFYFVSPDRKRGYFATASRPGGHGEKDIYMMPLKGLKEQTLLLVKGVVIPATGDKLPNDIEIAAFDPNGNVVGNYRMNKRDGRFIIIVPANSNYTVSITKGSAELFNENFIVGAEDPYREVEREVRLKAGGNGVVTPEGIKTKPEEAMNFVSLSGRLYDANNMPYANMIVHLLNSKGEIIKTTTTNDLGWFEFTPLAENEDYVVDFDSNKGVSKNTALEFRDAKGNPLQSNKQGEQKYKLNKSKTFAQIKLNDKSIAKESNTKETSSENKKSSVEVKPHEQLAKVTKTKFEMYFKYNIFETDVNDEPYREFVTNLMGLYGSNGNLNINILASASQVPTRKFKSNKVLAQNRADKAKEQLINALKEKGVDESKIKFVKIRAIVGGPTYNADYKTNKATYEKHQYVRIRVY